MNQHAYLTITLFTALTLLSCRKDEIIEVPAYEPVYAGIYDSDFYYSEYADPLQPVVLWDSQNLYGSGADSFDLNNDGLHDIILSVSLLNEDSVHLVSGYPNPFPYLDFQAKNGFEAALCSEFVYTGLGSGYTAHFIDTLSYGRRIDSLSAWGSDRMWREHPGSTGSFGSWYSPGKTGYVGIRWNKLKYGWIEMQMTDSLVPRVLRLALQK